MFILRFVIKCKNVSEAGTKHINEEIAPTSHNYINSLIRRFVPHTEDIIFKFGEVPQGYYTNRNSTKPPKSHVTSCKMHATEKKAQVCPLLSITLSNCFSADCQTSHHTIIMMKRVENINLIATVFDIPSF